MKLKMNRISHKCFRGGKVHKTFLLGFCIFAFVLFRVFWYRWCDGNCMQIKIMSILFLQYYG